jgi:hypothetical protein
MHRVDRREPSTGSGHFGPYRVDIVKDLPIRRAMRLRLRQEDFPGRTRVTVTGPVGPSSTCEIPLMDPFPYEVRLGCTAQLDGEPVPVTKRWFRPVEIALPSPIEIRRSGPFGYRIIEPATDAVFAQCRWGSTAIAGNLSPDIAAVVIAAIKTPLTEAVSPFGWFRGL